MKTNMGNRRKHAHGMKVARERCASSSPSKWAIWAEAARPKTLPAALAPVVAASGLAWHDGGFDWRAALLCAAFSLLMQIGANFANDYYDFLNGGDTAERRGPRRAVASGLVAARTMRAAMWAVFALGFALGLGLVAWGGWWLVGIGLVSVLCAIAYTGGPYPLAYHGWGDVFVFIFFGPVAVGATYYVQVGEWTWAAGLLSVPIGLLAANILVLNNIRDVEEDRRVGKRTTVVRFGHGFARTQFGTAFVVSFALPMLAVFGGGMSPWLLLPCALLPEAWRQQARLEGSHEARELIKLLGASGRVLGAYALLVAIGFVVSTPRVSGEGRIDREALVRRSSPVLHEIAPREALSVGNGNFSFTVDITGLQTLDAHYYESAQMRLGTSARWAVFDVTGESLLTTDTAQPHSAATGANLHSSLGQLGLVDERGRALRVEDFSEIEQRLDLWHGELVSRFQWKGFPVEVSTIAHPENDAVALRVKSPALEEGRLRVALDFLPREHAGGSGVEAVADAKAGPATYTTQRIERGRRRADFVRQGGELSYYTVLGWSDGGRLENPVQASASGAGSAANARDSAHRFILRPAHREDVLELTLEFSRVPLGPTHRLASWRTTRAAAARHWQSFWQTSTETDFSLYHSSIRAETSEGEIDDPGKRSLQDAGGP